MDRLYQSATVRSIDEKNRTATFVISTEDLDSHNSVIKQDGWDLTRYEKNPVVFYQHLSGGGWLSDPDPDNLIGTSDVWVEDGKLMGRVSFEPADINPLADKIFKKIIYGSLRAASVGFYPMKNTDGFGIEEDGEDPNIYYFRNNILTEWSVCHIGSNPATVIQKSIDKYISELSKTNEAQDKKIGLEVLKARSDYFKLKNLYS